MLGVETDPLAAGPHGTQGGAKNSKIPRRYRCSVEEIISQMLCISCSFLWPLDYLAGAMLFAFRSLGAPIPILIGTIVCVYFLIHNIVNQNSQPAIVTGYPELAEIHKHINSSSGTNQTVIHAPLSTRGRNIVDNNDARLKLVSVNWYGASDEFFVPGGLDVQHRSDIARTIRRLGFNSVRLPYADEVVLRNPLIESRHLTANSDLIGLKALEVFNAVVKALTDEGVAVIVNNHITKARWCCDGNPCDAQWSNDYLGFFCTVRQTEADWIRNWETVMRPFVFNPLVVGADLRNEVRGATGNFLWKAWATAAEKAAERLHSLNPEWLIIVEGVKSANDLSGARARPVRLSRPNKLVYSAHVYGWSGWGSLSPYWSRGYKSFAEDMYHNWAFLLEEDIAPVWVGEVGAPDKPNEGDLHYWKNLVRYLQDSDADFGYWAINPRKPAGNEPESYGLLEDDWATPVYDYRLYDMVRLATY